MKRHFELFGKKVPVIALVITLLVIGTASAAVFQHYATLSGTHEIPGTSITVYDSNGDFVDLDKIGVLNFNTATNFTINNSAVDPVTVYLKTGIVTKNTTGAVVDNEGITFNCTGANVTYEGCSSIGNCSFEVDVPGANGGEGESTVDVELSFAANIKEGNCTVTIDVNPFTS